MDIFKRNSHSNDRKTYRFEELNYILRKIMILKKSFNILLFSLLYVQLSFSQVSSVHKEFDTEFRLGLHLYDRQQFASALVHFENVEKQVIRNNYRFKDENEKLLFIQSQYYVAICGLELYNESSEKKLMAFVEKYPEQPLAKTASFELGNFYYRQKNYTTAIEWYKKTDISLLGNASRNELDFRYAYALYETDQRVEASEHFEKLLNKNSKYSYSAAYYDGIIAFDAKEYKEALERFEFLKASKTYAEIAPYYICKILYDTKKYDELITYSNEALQIPLVKNANEILVMTASASFSKKDWQKTIDYYEQAEKKTTLKDLSIYEFGYAYFQNQVYLKSINQLKKLADRKSPYSQHSLYLIGQCFYELNDKPSARNAFSKASKLNEEDFITASSLLNYAKLSFELNFYQTAIENLQDFIEKYPKNESIDEAQSILGEALLYTRNYKQAIEILEDIESRSKKADQAFQKVCYYRGLELFNEGKLTESLGLLNKSIAFPVNKNVESLCFYWKAEIYYQQKNYNEALKYYSMYDQANFQAEDFKVLVNYQLGYTYLKKEDYKSSIVYFDKFIKSESKLNAGSKLLFDAILRMADGYFVIKDYDKALFSYNKIITEKANGSDYALFQKGMILGLQNKQNDKIVTLKTLLSNYSSSTYADDATYEIGNGYFVMNNIQDALQAFLSLVKNYPNSRYVAKSRLSLGLIYYNEQQDDKAVEMYKAIIVDYPGTEEAKEALLAIKNIYVDAGNAEAYLSYVKTLPFASVSSGAQDSITYQAANNRFLLSDWENAINGFNNYIEKFANGSFIIDAHANRAECFMRTKKEKSALIDFEYLISISNPKYLERSLLYSGRIYYEMKDYVKASTTFTQLEQSAEFKDNYGEAIAGALKSFAALNDSAGILKYSQRVLSYEKSSVEDQYNAYLYLARYYYGINNIDKADENYRAVAKLTRTEAGAEAKYYIASILFSKGKYLDAQQACFDLSNQVPSYEYWVAKGFIILAESYSKLGNDFQAKSTLQSIIDEYSVQDDGIIIEAQKKLDEISQPR